VEQVGKTGQFADFWLWRNVMVLGGAVERRQRWAAFSVKAHRDPGSLAADILLYDRIILPVPEDDAEYDRWVRRNWAPDQLAPLAVQAAGHIISVPWTAQLRQEWRTRWDAMKALGEEVSYGMTGVIYASYPPAWEEIRTSLQPGEQPRRNPSLMAGFQSPGEAHAELALGAAEVAKKETEPGGRDVDRVVALNVRRMVYEPDIADPKERFLAAVSLAENSRFQEAQRNLFDWEDALYADGWTPEEVEKELPGLEEAYRDAVRAANQHMVVRAVTTLLPGAAGWVVTAMGHPHAKTVVSKSLSLVAGVFGGKEVRPEGLPGAALGKIRAAYREVEAKKVDRGGC
jgi:hypothetical protein